MRFGPTWLLALLVALPTIGCGVSAPRDSEGVRRPAITNGVTYNGHPSVGAIDLRGFDGQSYTCTGSVIGQRWVLTAAHCIQNIQSATFHVNGGAYPVAQMIAHPSYTSNPTRNDIALLRLHQSPGVTPVAVSTRAPWAGLQLTLVGFGITADGREDSGVKRMARNVVASVAPVTFNMRGTGGTVGNICSGDSGGPAFAMVDGQEVQIGVHSYGDGLCGMSEWDARVDPFISWLKTTTGNDIALPTPAGPTDKTAPTLSFVWQNGQQLEPGMHAAVLRAEDDIGVTKVELVVDGKPQGQQTQAPFAFDLDLEPGTFVLQARAHDASGKTATAQISITVTDSSSNPNPNPNPDPNPSTGKPEVNIIWPGAGSRIPVQTVVRATVGGEISTVVLEIDGNVVDVKRSSPFEFPITLTPGLHEIVVIAEGPQGDRGEAAVRVQADTNASATGDSGSLRQLVGGCNVAGADLGAGLGSALPLLGLMLLVFWRRRK